MDARRVRGPQRRPARTSAGAGRGRRAARRSIHVASLTGREAAAAPHTRLEYENALHNAVIRAALERKVERFVYVSSPLTFERAELLPTPEDHLARLPRTRLGGGLQPSSPASATAARRRAARPGVHDLPPFSDLRPGAWRHGEPGVAAAVERADSKGALGQRPLRVSASSEQTLTPTHVDDVADGDRHGAGLAGGRQRGLQPLRRARAEPSRRSRASCGWRAARAPTSWHSSRRPCQAIAVARARSWPSAEKAQRAARLAGADRLRRTAPLRTSPRCARPRQAGRRIGSAV